MSAHDCTGCWRYEDDHGVEVCIRCGAVRVPAGEVLTDDGYDPAVCDVKPQAAGPDEWSNREVQLA